MRTETMATGDGTRSSSSSRIITVRVPLDYRVGDATALMKGFTQGIPNSKDVEVASSVHRKHAKVASGDVHADCVTSGVSCDTDEDCADCGVMQTSANRAKVRFRCIRPPFGSPTVVSSGSHKSKRETGATSKPGVCGVRSSRFRPLCPEAFAVQEPFMMGGVVEWKCTSKYPHLVSAPSGRPHCCRGGRLVHARTGAPYVAGYHDPSECRCTSCRPGMVSDGQYECVRDPCYPGVTAVLGSAIHQTGPKPVPADGSGGAPFLSPSAVEGQRSRSVASAAVPYRAGRIGGPVGCDCPPGYVSCPGPAFLGVGTEELLTVCPRAMYSNVAVCVRDPCDPGWLSRQLVEIVVKAGDARHSAEYGHAEKRTGPYARFDLYRGRCVLTQLGRQVGARVVFGSPTSKPFESPLRGHVVRGDLRLCGGNRRLAPVRFPYLDPDEWWREWVDRANPGSGVVYDRFFNALREDYMEMKRRYVY